MNLLYAALLGLIQGVAEFLPISSSGHLALAEALLGRGPGAERIAAMDGSAFFSILLHLATLAAVIAAYRTDVGAMGAECAAIVRGLARGEGLASRNVPTRRLIFMILTATLPLLLVVPFHRALETLNAIPWFVGAALMMTGLLLYVADRIPPGRKTQRDMTVGDAVFIGLAQAAATIPGLSRSGTTITAGLSRGLRREFAVRFSFLMSLLSVADAIRDGVEASLLPAYLVGMLVAGGTGYFSIRLLQRIVSKGRFGGFAWYCWGVGAASILLSLRLG